MKFTKLIASLAAITTVVTSLTPVFILSVKADNAENIEAYDWTRENDLTSKDTFAEFNFPGLLTREAGAKFFSMGADALGMDLSSDQECDYADINSADPTLVDSINTACEMGIFKAQANFNPKQTLTRGQMEIVLGRMMFTMDGVNDYADENDLSETEAAHEMLKDAGVINVDVSFASQATRGMVALTLYRMSQMDLPEVPCTVGVDCPVDFTGTQTTGVVNEVKAGNLEVALNSSTPTSTVLVPKETIVTLGSYDFTAGSSDVTVRTVNIQSVGLTNDDNVDKVYFEMNGMRATTRSSLTTDGKAFVSFNSPLVIKAGSKATLDFVVTTKSTATVGAEFQFSVSSVDSSAVNTSVAANRTATARVADYNPARVTFSTGAGNVYRAGSSTNLEIGYFRLANNGTTDRDVVVKGIKVKNQPASGERGDVSKLQNLGLYRDNTKVSTAVTIDGDNILFGVNSDTIRFGQTANYYIKADVVDVEGVNGDSYAFMVKNYEDINVSETRNSVRAVIVDDSNVKLASNSAMGLYTVEGSELRLARDTSQVLNYNVIAGATDVVVAKGTVTSRTSFDIGDINAGLAINVGTGGIANTIQSVRVQVGNLVRTISIPSTATGVNTYSLADTDTATMGAGTYPVLITVNLRSTAVNTTVSLNNELSFTDFTTIEYSNGNAVTSFAGSIQSATVTIDNSVLTVAKNDGLGSTKNYVKGSTDVKVYGVQLSTSQADTIDVTRFDFTIASGTNGIATGGNLSLTLFVNGQSVQTKTVTSSTVSFSNSAAVSRTMPASVEVKATINTAVTANSTFKVSLSNVEARTHTNGTNVEASAIPNGALITATDFGTAIVSNAGANVPVSKILYPEASAEKVAAFNVKAENDDLTLKHFYVTTSLGTETSDRIMSAKLTDGTNDLGNGVVDNNGIIKFENLSNVMIPAGTTKTYYVALVANQINSRPSSTIEFTTQIATGTAPSTYGTNSGFIFNGTNGQNLGTSNVTLNVTSIGNTMAVAKSVPTITAIEAGKNGTDVFYKVTLQPRGGQVDMSSLTVDLTNRTTTGITNGFELRQSLNGGTVYATGTTNAAAGGTQSLTVSSFNNSLSFNTVDSFYVVVKNVDFTSNNNNSNPSVVVTLNDFDYLSQYADGTGEVVSALSTYYPSITTLTTLSQTVR